MRLWVSDAKGNADSYDEAKIVVVSTKPTVYVTLGDSTAQYSDGNHLGTVYNDKINTMWINGHFTNTQRAWFRIEYPESTGRGFVETESFNVKDNQQSWYRDIPKDAPPGIYEIKIDAVNSSITNDPNALRTTITLTVEVKERSPNTWILPMNGVRISRDWNKHVPAYVSSKDGRCCHLAIDMNGGDGKILAAADGIVVGRGYNSANGHYVVLEHILSGQTVYSFYAHLGATPIVSMNQTVSVGQQIGIVGKSGEYANNAIHLHYSVQNTLWTNGAYFGYGTHFSGDKTTFKGITFYNPHYLVEHGKLPD